MYGESLIPLLPIDIPFHISVKAWTTLHKVSIPLIKLKYDITEKLRVESL